MSLKDMDKEFLKDIASSSISVDGRKWVFTTSDMLWNQLKREAPNIADSFDNLFSEDINTLSSILAEVAGVLGYGLDEGNDFQKECCTVLMNSINTYVASVHLFRCGHRLEPLMLIRTIVESVAVVLHLNTRPSDLKCFREGRLKSTKFIRSACKVIPQIGELYGQLSNTVIHISDLHRNHNPLHLYKERDEAVNTNFGYLRFSIWLLYITAELINFNLISAPRYWREFDNGFKFSPDDEIKKWVDDFLNIRAKK